MALTDDEKWSLLLDLLFQKEQAAIDERERLGSPQVRNLAADAGDQRLAEVISKIQDLRRRLQREQLEHRQQNQALSEDAESAFRREIDLAARERFDRRLVNPPPDVTADLTEAQVGVLHRCPWCKKVVTDPCDPLDDEGRRSHATCRNKAGDLI